MKNFSLIISILFQPLLMATYGCLLLFFFIPNSIFDYLTPLESKVRLTLIIFAFTCVFPLINIFVLYKMKRIDSIMLSNPQDRTYPYLTTSIFYLGLFYLLKDVNVWSNIKLFILGGGITILIGSVINIKYKISAHMAGIGGLLGLLLAASPLIKYNLILFYIVIILISGFIGTARMVLNEHRASQVYSGFLLGLSIQLVLYFFSNQLPFINS